MSKTNNVTDFMADLAKAIRAKEGSTALISPQDMAQRIGAIGGKDIVKRERSNLTALLTDVADALRAVYGTTEAINPQDFATLVAGISVGDSYTPLTYIEATGAQYINTGYVVQEDDVIEMYYITTSTTSADKALFGVYDDGGNIWAAIYSNAAYIRFGSDASISISNARQRYKLTLQKGSVDIDGSKGTPAFTSMPSSPLYLFARNDKNASVSMYGYCKTFGFRITKASGEVVMNLKPCKRDSDNAIGMLDIVSGTFFVNQGSGDDFAYGAEVKLEDGYEAIDYVTFNANKLFDAGIINSSQTIEVLFERTETTKTPYLYGVITSPHTASVTAYMSSGGAWRFGASYKGYSTNTTKMYKAEVSNGKVVLDFTERTFTKTTFTTPNTLVVGGARAASGSTSKSYIGYIYYFRVKQGSEYIADWCPCRRVSDGVEGFWNCVSQKFVEPMEI